MTLSDSRMDAAHALLDVSITSSSCGRNLGALDALAALASSAHSLEEDGSVRDVSCPPSFPRYQRSRAVSNPEGMERWSDASLSTLVRRHRSSNDLCVHYEEDEDEALDAEKADDDRGDVTLSLIKALERKKYSSTGTVTTVISSDEDTYSRGKQQGTRSRSSTISSRSSSIGNAEDGVDIVKRARSRLLEDLDTTSAKGGLLLPHSSAKFKGIYNQDGRIGIYSTDERAAIISRYHSKRLRRVWNKKIRYNCRKDLADRRLRVKGRFVKRDSEEAKKYLASLSAESNTPQTTLNDMGPPPPVRMDGMPDVNDPEAGFCPTKDAPYRRCRRHTIT